MSEPETHRATGPARASTFPHDRVRVPLGIMLVLESLATAGAGLWLLWVVTAVLPARDPAHIPMWTAVAAGCLGFSGLCWACVATEARFPMLRWPVLAASLGAMSFGLYGIIAMMRQADAGGHFEGYVVLIGLILSGHGLTGIAYAVFAGPGRAVAGPGAGLAGTAS